MISILKKMLFPKHFARQAVGRHGGAGACSIPEMMRAIVDRYFLETGQSFQNNTRSEINKVLLFFGGQCFAYAFLLVALNPTIPWLWPNAGIHMSASFGGIGVICMLALSRRDRILVNKMDPVADEVLAQVLDHGGIPNRVKKALAIEVKRHRYVTYAQLFAFAEVEQLSGRSRDPSKGDAATSLVKALDDGRLD